MKCLITGGAGYIGSILVEYLLNENYRVTVIDNFMHDQQSLNHLVRQSGLTIINGDARDKRVVQGPIEKADVIIPLAAIVGFPACERDWNAATTTNCSAVQLAVSFLSKEQRMIIPITNSGYGIGKANEMCTEESPLKPLTHYGQTKVIAEKIALEHGNAVSLRLATVFGYSPRLRLDLMVNDLVHRALADRAIVLYQPNYRRNFIHVLDVARAFAYVIHNFETMKSQVFNVGLSTANLTKLQLAQKIAEHLPKTEIMIAPVGEDPDKRDYLVSNERIEAHGYRPWRSLDEGIRELIKGLAMVRFRDRRYSNV